MNGFFLKFFILLLLLFIPGAAASLLIKGKGYLLPFSAGYGTMFLYYLLIYRQSLRIREGQRGLGFFFRLSLTAAILILLIKVAHLALFAIISGVIWATVSFFITTFLLTRER